MCFGKDVEHSGLLDVVHKFRSSRSTCSEEPGLDLRKLGLRAVEVLVFGFSGNWSVGRGFRGRTVGMQRAPLLRWG